VFPFVVPKDFLEITRRGGEGVWLPGLRNPSETVLLLVQ
jgi:hypothetical protein